ncbi:MAG: type II secretion system protein, partial [Clostridiales bacterium]|nr:type II secretion system protein [Clostridiales bacterium]
MKRKVKGFTLIELIVVMGILAVLAGVLVPNMINSIRKAKVNT